MHKRGHLAGLAEYAVGLACVQEVHVVTCIAHLAHGQQRLAHGRDLHPHPTVFAGNMQLDPTFSFIDGADLEPAPVYVTLFFEASVGRAG